jgi:hypothetical protein
MHLEVSQDDILSEVFNECFQEQSVYTGNK